MASPGLLATSPKVLESIQKLLGKRPLKSPTTVLINNLHPNQQIPQQIAPATTLFEVPILPSKNFVKKEEVKNDFIGKESAKRVKLNQKVEVHTYRQPPPQEPMNKRANQRRGRQQESDYESSFESSEGSYSDEYSLSDGERVQVLSDESAYEDDDFDFLTSEKFFEHV